MGAATAVKAALFEAIAGLGFTTYTVIPQAADGGDNAQYPHVQIGTVVASAFDDNTTNGFDLTARIYTRWRGHKEQDGTLIQDALYDRLHRGALEINGYSLILMDRQLTSVTQLGGSFTGLCEYRALITEE
jgi:hypothetical protein